jgi:small subunit ribosomal protein S8
MKNYLWNMFANIKNAQMAKNSIVLQQRKKVCAAFLNILWNEGFILGYKVSETDSNMFKIFLKYKNGKPVINSLKPITKPSQRVYYSNKQLWKIKSSKGVVIFSTNKGLKVLDECKKLKLGGEPYIIIK